MFKTVTIKGKHSAALTSSLVAVEEKHSNSLIVDYLLGLFLLRFILIIFSLIYMQRLVVFRADSRVRQEDLHLFLTGGNRRKKAGPDRWGTLLLMGVEGEGRER